MTDWAQTKTPQSMTGYSVRPDIWPPGTLVRALDGTPLAEWHYTTSAWVLRGWADQAATMATPGVAESMVLQGHMDIVERQEGQIWEPCPRPEGSA